MRRLFHPVALSVTMCVAILFVTNFGNFDVGYASSTVTLERDVIADLAQEIESLRAEVVSLRKTVQTLSDLIWDLQKALAGSKTPAKVKQTSAASLPKLRSPRQIDRPPTGKAEKTAVLLQKAKVDIEDETLEKACTDLLTTKRGGNFVNSLRIQLTEWLETPSADRSFPTPFSVKQYAWVLHILYPNSYENPRMNPELYPNG